VIILVVDDMPIFREPIAASLRGAGYQTVTACNGKEALAKILLGRPDLILLDVAMPVMDGITFLSHLRANADTCSLPVILLTAMSDKDNIIQAAKLGIQDYLLKSRFSLQELLARIKKYESTTSESAKSVTLPATTSAPRSIPTELAKPNVPAREPPPRSQWPKLLSREQTLEQLDKIADTKTIAGVVAQIISLANSPRADLADIVRVINTDPILASRVLQLANSAAFSANRGRVSTVEDAARNLGVREIQNMALSIGIFGAFPPDEQDGFNTLRCWQHSFAVADIMNLFVGDRDPLQKSMNHLVGLCHDLGEILLRQHFASTFNQILDFAAAHKLPIHAVESAALGIRHPELISRLLSRIGLPQSAIDVIREFYERQTRADAAGMSQPARSLFTANQIAHGLLLAPSTRETVAPISRTEWRFLAGDKTPPPLDPAAKRSEILVATNILARLPAKEEARLIAPILSRRHLRICYLRPESYIELDSLAFALSLTTECTNVQSLPKSAELADFDALIAVAIRPNTGPVLLSDFKTATEAAGLPNFPILVLTDQGAAPCESPPNITHLTYPLSLADLHDWLTQTVSRKPRPASA
jgi:HD-like signal output (HDOD) protein/CheY-like chemotaxis protein